MSHSSSGEVKLPFDPKAGCPLSGNHCWDGPCKRQKGYNTELASAVCCHRCIICPSTDDRLLTRKAKPPLSLGRQQSLPRRRRDVLPRGGLSSLAPALHLLAHHLLPHSVQLLTQSRHLRLVVPLHLAALHLLVDTHLVLGTCHSTTTMTQTVQAHAGTYRYCTGNVQVRTGTVQVLYRYVQVLYRYCTGTYRYCAGTVQVLYRYVKAGMKQDWQGCSS